MKLLRKILPAFLTFSLALLASSALAAPPGWELRNGTWVPLVEPGTGTPEAQVAKMIRDLRDNGGAASNNVIKDAKAWIKVNPRHPLMPQVLLLQGDAEVLRGNKYAALYPYEDLLNNYPTSELFLPVLEREFTLSDAFLNGYKRKFLGFRMLPVTDDALQLLDRIQDRQRGSAIAEQAGLRVADYYYNDGKFPEALDAYTDFLKRYPYSQFVRKAEIRRAEASLGDFRGLLFDFTPLYDARERLATITNAFPQTAEELQARAIDDRIYQLEGQKELEIARYYFRAGKKYAAAYYYKRVASNWPDTAFADTARKELFARLPSMAGGLSK
ncbi:MAG TPA: outer membrane protein assembly factor BamD [Phycisphaerae bacterium]|jgi:outer membrane protein assembly factor BamD (BamD/ComL family)